MTKFTTRFTATLAATLCLIGGAPAFASETVSNGRQVEVRYGDLDLTQAQDKSELNRRIKSAAFKVCSGRVLAEVNACRDQTLKNTQEPVATAIARAETKARYADAGSGMTTGASSSVVVGN